MFCLPIAVPGDISTQELLEIVRRTVERFGRVDVLVNNAALARSTRFGDLTADEWRMALEVNLTAPFLLTQAVLPTMKAQGYGQIINVSSSAGRMVSTLGGAHYTASGTVVRADAGVGEGARKVRDHGERRVPWDDRH